MLREAYISLFLPFKDRSSAFVVKGSVKWARREDISVHLHTLYHRLRFAPCVTDYVCKARDGEGRDSAVGITTPYGLDGQGIESRW